MDNSEKSIQHILTKFKASLDRHGYGFQYRVLKAADDLFRTKISSFAFEVAEFPVEVQSSDTKVSTSYCDEPSALHFEQMAQLRRLEGDRCSWLLSASERIPPFQTGAS